MRVPVCVLLYLFYFCMSERVCFYTGDFFQLVIDACLCAFVRLCVFANAFLDVGMRVSKHTEVRAFSSCVCVHFCRACKHFCRACKHLCICVCVHARKYRIGARSSIYARVRVVFSVVSYALPVTAHEPFFFCRSLIMGLSNLYRLARGGRVLRSAEFKK